MILNVFVRNRIFAQHIEKKSANDLQQKFYQKKEVQANVRSSKYDTNVRKLSCSSWTLSLPS
jgi:hypothetical protein